MHDFVLKKTICHLLITIPDDFAPPRNVVVMPSGTDRYDGNITISWDPACLEDELIIGLVS